MSELIHTVVSIKDPFTLFAFLAVVLLIAFRTKTVPESMFKLIGDKITRERFYLLLNRSLLYGFAVFLVLCSIAALGQVLGYMTTARAASVDALKAELELRKADTSAAKVAIDAYQKGLAFAENNRVSEAIASLEASLKAVPTLIAREMLALLHHQAGNTKRATELAEQLVSASRDTGAMNRARAERVLRDVSTPPPVFASKGCPADAGLVGTKLDLPSGGETFETATTLVPCVYRGLIDTENWKYYKLSVQSGQTLKVEFRLRDADIGFLNNLYVRLHGPTGARTGEEDTVEPSSARTLEYKAEASGFLYVGVRGPARDSVFQLSLR